MKPKILVFVACYLPGYKAGGPVRTIANMVDSLAEDFDFWIITKDRDLGEVTQYADVQPDRWQVVGNAMVYYLPPESCSVSKVAKLIANTSYDVLYLNSFFGFVFTIKPLLARLLGYLPDKPLIVAPRGEFSTGALNLKCIKKKIYLEISKKLGLYKNIIWHASSEHEAQDIIKTMAVNRGNIHVAINLPKPVKLATSLDTPLCSESNSGELKVIFLSRISPMKNLAYALETLSEVKARVVFDIYGPTEDEHYWTKCKGLIDLLPENISVNYCGSVLPEQVAATFGRYDLFFFPTLGENYGHVIAEALSVGTPVILSDQTPWRNLQDDRMGWDLPLENRDEFVRVIDGFSSMTRIEKNNSRMHIKKIIIDHLTDPQIFEANCQLFKSAISGRSPV